MLRKRRSKKKAENKRSYGDFEYSFNKLSHRSLWPAGGATEKEQPGSPGLVDDDLPFTLRLPGRPGEHVKVCFAVRKHMSPHRKGGRPPTRGDLHTHKGMLLSRAASSGALLQGAFVQARSSPAPQDLFQKAVRFSERQGLLLGPSRRAPLPWTVEAAFICPAAAHHTSSPPWSRREGDGR